MLLDARVQINRVDIIIGIEQGINALLKRHGFAELKADAIAGAIAEQFSSMFVRENTIIPKDKRYRQYKLWCAVASGFNGNNHIELCRKFDISTRHVCEIIRKAQRKEILEPSRAEFLAVVVEMVVQLLRKECGEQSARQIGNEVADYIAENYGGIAIWFPNGYSLKTARRDATLLRSFDGSNHEALAEQHGLPLDDVHEILGRYRNLPLRAPA